MSLLSELDGYLTHDKNEDDISELNIDLIMGEGISVQKNFTEDDADPNELSMGIAIEMEHTTHKDISKKIALDHLAEIPDYYTRLKKMEEEAGVNVDELYSY